ncbi:MAG: efflux RND transporter permease subunit, partial [Acidobacteriota bacterium]
LQRFMCAIRAPGIAIATSILLVTFSDLARRSGGTLAVAAAARLRAVLMTAFAMMAGMTPMALGAAQTAPLGRAVLGGLALATVATLTVVPLFYNILQPQNARDASLLPHEENS